MRSLRSMGLFVCLMAVLVGCSSEPNNNTIPRPADCYGKCDGVSDIWKSPWQADIERLNAIWPGSVPIEKVEDAYTVQVDLGEAKFPAPTHLFGVPVNVIPYSNDDNIEDADGQPVPRGDSVIAQVFPPGAIGWAVKHHRPEHRSLAPDDLQDNMKEQMKLQDTHIELVVGVYRDAIPGAITLNNPQNYEQGYFGDPVYSMFFVRPVYPDWLGSDEESSFNDNIRTMMLAFNAVSDFPGNYNGGDPLAANSVEKLREHVVKMVEAIAGDAAAQAWFEDPANLIYCAELAHVSASAGIHFPLNDRTMVPLVGETTWSTFKEQVELHNAGEASNFTTMNANTRAALVQAALAPESLEGIATYAPAQEQSAARQTLAFQPMTMADIVEQFMRTHIPRELLGESLAPAQGLLLAKMKPGLLEAMAMDQLPTDDPRRMAVEALHAQLVETVSRQYESYEAFRAALEPLMAQARAMTGPRDDTGAGLFVPPSLLHVIAQGKHDGGLLGLQYVGHGIHFSATKKSGAPDQPEPTDPPDDPADAPFEGSCRMSCGGAAPGNSCYCDEVCSNYGDCCEDLAEFCG